MILRTALRVALAIAVTLPLQSNTAAYANKSSLQADSPKSHKVVSQETYTRVLDTVFPRETAKSYFFVLRFGPSFHPESQIVITGGTDRVEVIEYTSLSGNIYGKLNTVLANGGSEDAVEMAKLIKVRRRSIYVTYAKFEEWQASFFDSLCELSKSFHDQAERLDKQGTITVPLDGTYYELWYRQFGDLSFRVLDEEVSEQQPNGALEIVRWMNGIRQDVEKLR